MEFRAKLTSPYLPVTLFEMAPPAAEKPGAIETALAEVEKVRHRVDAINLPEIRDEAREGGRAVRFVERIEPRILGGHIRKDLGMDVVLNRCVVYDADPLAWFQKTAEVFDLRHVVLVGGERSGAQYPGPDVMEAARQVRAAGMDATLGGITIPSRLHEAERVRRKAAAGLSFFTTQVLFDSNDIVWLIQRLNGLEARIFLSFAPVSHPRDLEFLRWLGADIPADLDGFLLRGETNGSAKAPGESVLAERSGNLAGAVAGALDGSLDLCQRILMDVFDNLPPDPPPIGLNIEHINKRNLPAAVRMLDRLNDLYRHLVSTHARASLA